MLHIYSITPAKDKDFARAVVIGNFDGVHLGHQTLINTLIAEAKSRGLRKTVLILEPQPREYFHLNASKSLDDSPTRILPLSAKISQLSAMGIDEVAVLHFRRNVAACSAQAFVQQILMQELNAKLVMTGKDFCFGQSRLGNTKTLNELGKTHGFAFYELPDVLQENGVRYSSTLIRKWLSVGDFKSVNLALGKYYTLTARVASGLGLASQWDIPTANLYFRQKLAVSGVFAGSVKITHLTKKLKQTSLANLTNSSWGAVLHLGKPDSSRSINQFEKLEVHLLDFPNMSLLGSRLAVSFIHKIRESTPFTDETKLKERIMKDREEVITWLAKMPRSDFYAKGQQL